MPTVPSKARMLSICSRPTGATNQRKMERHYSIQRNFPAVSLKNSIQVSNKVLVTSSCVCVTENKNLYKETAVRFSQTGSTGQRKLIPEIHHFAKKFPLGSSVSMEISRQFGTMESIPSMPLPFIWNTHYLGPNTWASWPDMQFCRDLGTLGKHNKIQLSHSSPGLAGLFNFVITWQ